MLNVHIQTCNKGITMMKTGFYFKLIMTICALSSCCFSNGAEIIHAAHKIRSQVFNTEPDSENKVLTQTEHTDKDVLLGQHTTTINTILNNKNVSRRPATATEKKTILQAVMGTIIIHHSDSSYLLHDHDLIETDEFFKHFKILKFTEDFAETCLETMIRSNNHDYAVLDTIDKDLYAQLYEYSGLDHDLMIEWFKEVYKNHIIGIKLKPSQTTTQTIQRKIAFPRRSIDLRTSNDLTEGESKELPETGQITLSFDEIHPNTTPTKTIQESALIAAVLSLPKQIEHVTLAGDDLVSPHLRNTMFQNPLLTNPSSASDRPTKSTLIPLAETAPISKKSNWKNSWKLKNGITIIHHPGCIELTGPIICTKNLEINFDNKNIRGTVVNIHVATDMTEQEFIDALNKDGNLT